jgi:carbon storage regulator CsrA
MLVLSRRPNEKIVIPGLNLTIQVVAINPGVVRIGIQAPPDIPIVRDELLDPAETQVAQPPSDHPSDTFARSEPRKCVDLRSLEVGDVPTDLVKKHEGERDCRYSNGGDGEEMKNP